MKNTDIIITIASVSILLFLLSAFIFSFVSIYQRKRKQHKFETSALQSQFSQTLLQTQLEIQEQTLHTISQEIHDNIGQVLSLAKLNIGTMDLHQPELLLQKIDDSKHLVAKAIHDLRDLSKSLHTGYVQQMGLFKAIEYELEMLRKAGKHQTTLTPEGEPFRFDSQKELIIFRMVQEILNNIIKHANATHILVSTNFTPDFFSLTITDNGDGFDSQLMEEPGNTTMGLGIKNMTNRAKLIGAVFTLTSTTGNGTLIKIVLPFNQNNPEHAHP
ncbi:MAG: sensor histidine kinase [Chitinophagaceae bacterium]